MYPKDDQQLSSWITPHSTQENLLLLTVNLANHPWLIGPRESRGQPTTSTFLNQYNSQLYSENWSLYTQHNSHLSAKKLPPQKTETIREIHTDQNVEKNDYGVPIPIDTCTMQPSHWRLREYHGRVRETVRARAPEHLLGNNVFYAWWVFVNMVS